VYARKKTTTTKQFSSIPSDVQKVEMIKKKIKSNTNPLLKSRLTKKFVENK
jgi:hypothetical protein